MGIIISSVLIAGILINTIFEGFNTINIILLTEAALLLIYNIPAVNKMLKFGNSKKRDILFNVIVYIVLLGVAFSVIKLLSPENQFSFSNDINQSAKLIQDGDLKSAEKILQKLYKKDPTNPVINLNLSNIYLKSGHIDLVKSHLDSAARLMSFDENVWYNYGMMYLQNKDNKNAQKCFEQAIELNPQMTKAHVYAGTTSYKLREIRKAIYHLENARVLNPQSPEILLHLGRANIELMEYKQAEQNFKEALELKPTSTLTSAIKEQIEYVNSIKGGAQQ